MKYLRDCLLLLSLLSSPQLPLMAAAGTAQSESAGAAREPGIVAASSEAARSEAARIDEYLNRLAGFGFTGAVLVAKDGRVIIERGYGLADRRRNIPFTKETVFDIGSNTKDFTKLAILQLSARGLVALSDPISKFFDNVPADKAVITVAQLLDHTAGFGMYSGRDEELITKQEFLKRLFSAPLSAAPGTKESYSNPGYSLLAAIIEKVSGLSYEQYAREHIFKPAGMLRTGYALPGWKDGEIARNYADGEDRPPTSDYPRLQDGVSWSLRGNGGMLSTLGDMYRFNLALEAGLLLPKESGTKLFPLDEPIELVGGNGVHYFVYLRNPASRLVILIATVDAGLRATEITDPLLALARGRNIAMPPRIVKVGGGELVKYAGKHRLGSGAELEISTSGERLHVAAANQEGFALLSGGARGNEERIARMNAQARAILEAGAKGEHKPLYQAFGASMPYEEFISRQETAWQRRGERLGRFVGVTVLGTARAQGGFATTARLDFERGAEYVQFMWGGGGLRGIRLSAKAPGMHFHPQSATEFVSFNPASGASMFLSFTRDEKSGGLSVVLRESNESGPPVAKEAERSGAAQLPDSAAGRLAAAYFAAFNSGDEKLMKDFITNRFAQASQAGRTIEQRLDIYRQMRDDLGDLEVEAFAENGEQSISVTMRAKKGGRAVFHFEVDATEPQKVKSIRVERQE